MKDKDVPTTANTEPKRPSYPAIRKPAKGPLISTANIDRIQKDNAVVAKDKKRKK